MVRRLYGVSNWGNKRHTEEVSHGTIEPLGMTDEMRGEGINVILIRLEAGKLPATDANRSSQNGMVKTMRLDFVAEVT
jgi:hypothetical protein